MILSFDFGTSSLKIAMLDAQLDVVASSTVPYHFDIESGDHVTLSEKVLWSALREGIQAMGNTDLVELIVYDAFSPSIVLMDESGNALYPIVTHLDRRAKKQSLQIQHSIGAKEFQKETGLLPFTGGASVTTMMWFPCLKITGGLTRIEGYCDFKKRLFNVDKYQVMDDCTIRGNAILALEMQNIT